MFGPAQYMVFQLRRNEDVMLSKAKHLAFSSCYEDEILRLRLRMTLSYSFFCRKKGCRVTHGGL